MLLRPWRNAASTCEEAAREPLRRYPITGIGCRCARVTPGQATAAPPSSVMNVRRLMGLSLQPHSASRGYHIRGDACCASQQISAAHVGCGSFSSDGQAPAAHGMSALPPKADKAQTCRHVRLVPKGDICSAANTLCLFNHLVCAG